MVAILYLLIAFVGSYIFIKRAQRVFWKVDTSDLFAAICVGLLWPVYFTNLVVLRIINGDWND
uniref:Membrane protein n=1 Tax=Salmonella phage vB_SEnST11_KE22 TaxID=3161173 RepID=A0AAU8GF20_9CAUD